MFLPCSFRVSVTSHRKSAPPRVCVIFFCQHEMGRLADLHLAQQRLRFALVSWGRALHSEQRAMHLWFRQVDPLPPPLFPLSLHTHLFAPPVCTHEANTCAEAKPCDAAHAHQQLYIYIYIYNCSHNSLTLARSDSKRCAGACASLAPMRGGHVRREPPLTPYNSGVCVCVCVCVCVYIYVAVTSVESRLLRHTTVVSLSANAVKET